jgi:teichuronic acid biosynthesis glycosyltransferase TuaG
MPPLVSVVMPAHNAATTIARAVESVTGQSLSDLELLVVDDASTDNTRELLQFLAKSDARVVPLATRTQGGAAVARNVAIDRASGRYLAFLDADDSWAPEKLARQIGRMEEAGALASCTAYKFVGGARGTSKDVVPPSNITLRDFEAGNPIGNLTGLYDCAALGKVTQKAIGHEDYAMWIEVCRRSGGVLGVQETLATYYAGGPSLSGNKWRAAGWTWNILRSELRLPFAKAISGMIQYAFNGLRRHRAL